MTLAKLHMQSKMRVFEHMAHNTFAPDCVRSASM